MPAKKVTINLEAQTASFIDGLDKAGKSLDGLGRRAEGARGFLENFKKGFELAGGFEAFHEGVDLLKKGLEQVKQAFEDVGEIGRNALKLGIGVENMSRFQHAANSAHVDISALTTGMDFLNRQIGLIASGDKSAEKAASALQKLGLNAKELSQLDPAETFKRVSAALAGMTDNYQKAAIVQELLSRGGRELIPLMDHLNQSMAESDDIGFTRTAANIASVEQAERDMARATDSLKGSLMDLASSEWAEKLISTVAGATQEINHLLDDHGPEQAKLTYMRDMASLTRQQEQAEADVKKAALESLDEQIDAQKKLTAIIRQRAELQAKAPAAKPMEAMWDRGPGHEIGPNGTFWQFDDNAKHGYTGGASTEEFAASAKARLALEQALEAQEKITAGLEAHKKAQDEVRASDAATEAIMDRMAKRSDGIAAALAPLRQKLDDIGKSDAAKEIEKVDAALAKLGVTDGAAHAMAAKLVEDLDKATVAAKNNALAKDEIDRLQKKIANEAAGEHFQGDADPKLLNQIHDFEKSLKSAEDHQSNIAEGKRLWEESETAVQKYADALKEVKKLEDDSAVSATQAAQIKQHLADQYQKSLGGKDEKDRQAPLIERQFTFAMGAVQKDNPSQQILDLHQRVFAGWETYLHDLWQKATDAAAPIVFDLTESGLA